MADRRRRLRRLVLPEEVVPAVRRKGGRPDRVVGRRGTLALLGGYLQTRSGDEWVQQREVTKGGFVNSLSADGNTLVSSSGYEEKAYVYTRSGGVWGEPVALAPEFVFGREPRFGDATAVSANGDIILVAAPENDERFNEFPGAGGVWVFARVGETWTEQTILHAGSEAQCGTSVALSADGNTAVIGCGYGDHDDYVFVREKPEGWTRTATLPAPGDLLAMTADGQTVFTGGSESAWVYQGSGESWSRTGEIPPLGPPGVNSFGPIAVAPEGTHLLLNEGNEGAVLYEGSGGSWTAIEGLLPLGLTKFEYGGPELAISTDAQVILTGDSPEISSHPDGVWEFTPGEPVQGPELGRCVQHPRIMDGTFSDTDCSKMQPKKGLRQEWAPGAGKAGFTLAGSGVTLSTHSRQSITCSGLSGAGVLGRKTFTGLHLTLTGCDLAGQHCASTMASPGQINSEELQGILGVETETPKRKVGIAISAPSVFAAFTCGTIAVSIRGAVIGSVKAGKPESSLTLNFKAAKGVQKPNRFVGGPEQKLEASFAGGAYERVGVRAKPTATYEETLELNPLY